MSNENIISKTDFLTLSHILKKNIGLHLAEEKIYLLSSRLTPIMRSYSIESFSILAYLLSNNSKAGLLDEVIDAMTINETYFFRDTKSFTDIRNVLLPRIQKQASNHRVIKVWSAASSTGQEAYSFAIEASENKAINPQFEYEILGTDICNRVINQATKGIYEQFEIQRGLPTAMLLKYFKQVDPTHWQVSDEIRKMVSFKKHNLLHELQHDSSFDLILCRNVLIYFDDHTKAEIIRELVKKLAPNGMLLIASTESLAGIDTKLVPLSEVAGAYVKS